MKLWFFKFVVNSPQPNLFMKLTLPHCRCIRVLLLSLAFAPPPLPAAEPVRQPPAPATNAVQFTPPKTRAIGLKRQINAGSRSGGQKLAVPVALVPDGLGLSSTEQPVLWWFLTQSTTAKVEFTLNRSFETLVKVELPKPTGAGLQSVNLANLAKDVAVKLTPGSPYEWTVRIKQGDDPAEHPVTVGWVEYRPVEAGLQAKVGTTAAGQLPVLYAGEGYWYDAVNLLATPPVKADLEPLLRQVGLPNVVVLRP